MGKDCILLLVFYTSNKMSYKKIEPSRWSLPLVEGGLNPDKSLTKNQMYIISPKVAGT